MRRSELAGALARHIEHDVGRHFDFEEPELFPRLDEAGEGYIAALLKEEHDAIRMVAEELLPLARAAAAGTLDNAGLDALKRASVEMIERQVAHIQKETMALLPMLAICSTRTPTARSRSRTRQARRPGRIVGR